MIEKESVESKMEQKSIKATRLKEWMPIIEESLRAGKPVRFSPRGISMLPMIRQGEDCVVLSAAPERLRKYDIPLYQRDDGKYILHRIVKIQKNEAGEETYSCVGDNQFELEYGVRRDQILAVVTAFSHCGREYSVLEWKYRIYCWFWHYSRPGRRFFRRAKGWLRRHFS